MHGSTFFFVLLNIALPTFAMKPVVPICTQAAKAAAPLHPLVSSILEKGLRPTDLEALVAQKLLPSDPEHIDALIQAIGAAYSEAPKEIAWNRRDLDLPPVAEEDKDKPMEWNFDDPIEKARTAAVDRLWKEQLPPKRSFDLLLTYLTNPVSTLPKEISPSQGTEWYTNHLFKLQSKGFPVSTNNNPHHILNWLRQIRDELPLIEKLIMETQKRDWNPNQPPAVLIRGSFGSGRAKANGSDIDISIYTQGRLKEGRMNLIKNLTFNQRFASFLYQAQKQAGLDKLPLQLVVSARNDLPDLSKITFGSLISPISIWIENGKIELLITPVYSDITLSLGTAQPFVANDDRPLPYQRLGIE